MKIQITYQFNPDRFSYKMKLIRILKENTGLGLKEAKDKVDCNDIIINVSHDSYLNIIRELEEFIECGDIVIKNLDKVDKLKSAKKAVFFNTDCVLITKKEYTELCNDKILYKHLKDSLDKLISEFKKEITVDN